MCSVPHLRNRADGVNLSDERAVGLKEEEELEMQLVKPLTQLQLLEDMRTTSDLTVTSTIGIDVLIEEQATCSMHTCTGIKYSVKACRLFCME